MKTDDIVSDELELRERLLKLALDDIPNASEYSLRERVDELARIVKGHGPAQMPALHGRTARAVRPGNAYQFAERTDGRTQEADSPAPGLDLAKVNQASVDKFEKAHNAVPPANFLITEVDLDTYMFKRRAVPGRGVVIFHGDTVSLVPNYNGGFTLGLIRLGGGALAGDVAGKPVAVMSDAALKAKVDEMSDAALKAKIEATERNKLDGDKEERPRRDYKGHGEPI